METINVADTAHVFFFFFCFAFFLTWFSHLLRASLERHKAQWGTIQVLRANVRKKEKKNNRQQEEGYLCCGRNISGKRGRRIHRCQSEALVLLHAPLTPFFYFDVLQILHLFIQQMMEIVH